MSTPPGSRSSLARSTLIKMGARVAVVIALTTLASYFHILQTLRAVVLSQLEKHVRDHSEREAELFLLANDSHTVLKRVLEARIRAARQEGSIARFDSLFTPHPDGTIRSRPERFDATTMPGLWVGQGVKADTELRQRLLASHDVLTGYGPALHVRFTNTYVLFPDEAALIYWPDSPTTSQQIPASYSLRTFEYFTSSLPENNPERQTTWSGIYKDPSTRKWMVSVITPLDMEGRHVATLGHDLFLDELMERTIRSKMSGTYNLLFREDGQLIAHPDMELERGTTGYNILKGADAPGETPTWSGTAEQQAHLRAIFERVKNQPPDGTVLELAEHDEYLAVARLKGPGWYFVTVLPERELSASALDAARYVLMFGLASLLLELVIMSWVLRQQITRPLTAFTQATDQVAAGRFQVELDTRRDDELGRLAQGFQLMAHEVQLREEALRQANEGLEQRVEARTRELKAVHQQLVDTARQAGMAEIATNVLHNVGNVLNSISATTLMSTERLNRMRLEQVGQIGALLGQHQGELATFLSQDERGRTVVPYLERLGLSLVEDRRELLSHLTEIGRFTEHVDNIIKLQQSYARKPRVREAVLLSELIEDALRINSQGLSRHAVKVEQHLAPLSPTLTDKHKVLMILVNLINNARYALDATPDEQRRLTVRLEQPSADRLRLQVIDNGVGIAPEMLTRIFQYGFTTREHGHGFGLHSSALAAQELGGSLTVHSDGPGRGARFTLELPYAPADGNGERGGPQAQGGAPQA
jgi:two-component system NtrC family sensor kinase